MSILNNIYSVGTAAAGQTYTVNVGAVGGGGGGVGISSFPPVIVNRSTASEAIKKFLANPASSMTLEECRDLFAAKFGDGWQVPIELRDGSDFWDIVIDRLRLACEFESAQFESYEFWRLRADR